ncbi:hypothetical protein F2Q68_00016339 [Brassica cretica]|uniref:Uncharacterized protein n=1 Tax=Brassica cretica TaxID=69181 RepID=A0A8S9HIA5_BRACR|nr:hypothetical protein F2Q68_00016339 [Brassica cretica]
MGVRNDMAAFGRYIATRFALDRSLRSDRTKGLVDRYVVTDSFAGRSLPTDSFAGRSLPSVLVGCYVATDRVAWSVATPSGLVGRYVACSRTDRIDLDRLGVIRLGPGLGAPDPMKDLSVADRTRTVGTKRSKARKGKEAAGASGQVGLDGTNPTQVLPTQAGLVNNETGEPMVLILPTEVQVTDLNNPQGLGREEEAESSHAEDQTGYGTGT